MPPDVKHIHSPRLIANHNSCLVRGDKEGTLYILSPGHGLQPESQLEQAEKVTPDAQGTIVIRHTQCVGNSDDLVFNDRPLKMLPLTVDWEKRHAFTIGVAFHDGDWYVDEAGPKGYSAP